MWCRRRRQGIVFILEQVVSEVQAEGLRRATSFETPQLGFFGIVDV